MGATITWISPVNTKIENTKIENGTVFFDEVLPKDFISSINTLSTVGAAISAYFYTHIADKFGRKITILSIGVPYLMSYLIMGIWRTVKTYFVARFVLGVAMGGTFSVIPIYAGEISCKYNRATLNSIGGVMLAAGGLFSYVIGSLLSLDHYNLTLAFFPAIFFPLFFIFGVETAHFYMYKNQEDLARQAFVKLRIPNEEIERELEHVVNIIKAQSQTTMFNFIRNKVFIKVFTSVIGLLMFQQLTGINAIIMFNETIYELTESNFDSSVCCVIIGIVQFFSSLLVLTYEERFGRKTLLITSALTMSILLTILGIHCVFLNYGIINIYLKLLPLIVLSLFVISYFIGIGPIPFVILSEIFPWRVKSIAVSVVSTIYWITVFLIVTYFHSFATTVGPDSCFLSLAALCIICAVFVYFYVEETKGKTFEEIQEIFK